MTSNFSPVKSLSNEAFEAQSTGTNAFEYSEFVEGTMINSKYTDQRANEKIIIWIWETAIKTRLIRKTIFLVLLTSFSAIQAELILVTSIIHTYPDTPSLYIQHSPAL